MKKTPQVTPPSPGSFQVPEGWVLSPHRNTSRYAMEVAYGRHAWRGIYLNDGAGNGYFAPGWNGVRLARNMRVVQRVAGTLTILSLLFFSGWTVKTVLENKEYYRLSAEGVQAQALVQSVSTETSTRHRKNTDRTYTTDTAAVVTYSVGGDSFSGTVEHRSHSKDGYPEPEWRPGESVELYADPAAPEKIVVLSPYLEERTNPVNGSTWFLMIMGLGLSAVPAVIYFVSRSSRRKAEAL
ncbi:DUF3592 domain-containing protein [Arthrobacter koreensis]|uniref:DUF3592 domain-containing protein n=1 Tax=Arthrobacter koreensis TaxID=199136 RepID=UPI0036D8C07B